MTKTFLLGLAALAIATTAAHADTYYKGRIKWVGVNAGCSGGPNLGDRDNAIYHPFAAKEPFASLNTFWTYGADGRQLDGQAFDSVLRSVTSAKSVGENSYNPANNPKAIIKVSVAAASVNATARTIVVEGQIQNPWGDENWNACIVDYLFTGIRN
jgi:hypothetical protein